MTALGLFSYVAFLRDLMRLFAPLGRINLLVPHHNAAAAPSSDTLPLVVVHCINHRVLATDVPCRQAEMLRAVDEARH
jgi:hypothetical protein